MHFFQDFINFNDFFIHITAFVLNLFIQQTILSLYKLINILYSRLCFIIYFYVLGLQLVINLAHLRLCLIVDFINIYLKF